MNTILLGYLLALLYLSTKKEHIVSLSAFRSSWMWFTLVAFNQVFFTLFRVAVASGPVRRASDLELVDIWANGVAWLLLGISLLALRNALTEKTK